MNDDATSNVIGTILMLGLVSMLMGPAYLLVGSILDATNAQREAAEKNQWCAEHPDRKWPGEGKCPDAGPRGWNCEPGQPDGTLKCVDVESDDDPDDYILVANTSENVPSVDSR